MHQVDELYARRLIVFRQLEAGSGELQELQFRYFTKNLAKVVWILEFSVVNRQLSRMHAVLSSEFNEERHQMVAVRVLEIHFDRVKMLLEAHDFINRIDP